MHDLTMMFFCFWSFFLGSRTMTGVKYKVKVFEKFSSVMVSCFFFWLLQCPLSLNKTDFLIYFKWIVKYWNQFVSQVLKFGMKQHAGNFRSNCQMHVTDPVPYFLQAKNDSAWWSLCCPLVAEASWSDEDPRSSRKHLRACGS